MNVRTDIDEDYDPMAGYEPAGLSHQSGEHVIFYLINFDNMCLVLPSTKNLLLTCIYVIYLYLLMFCIFLYCISYDIILFVNQ